MEYLEKFKYNDDMFNDMLGFYENISKLISKDEDIDNFIDIYFQKSQ